MEVFNGFSNNFIISHFYLSFNHLRIYFVGG
nr:MAG TPA: hypothetical protein [Caudoviricetes sp.]